MTGTMKYLARESKRPADCISKCNLKQTKIKSPGLSQVVVPGNRNIARHKYSFNGSKGIRTQACPDGLDKS